MFGVIVGLIILMVLVVIHELGHAIVAHRNGVVVEEFGVGFPPTALKKKLKNGVLVSLNWLPLGGFVKLKGEHDSAKKPGDYGAATFWQKTKILFAGVIANWVVAAVLFSILAIFGLPKIIPDQVMLPFDTENTYHHVEIVSLVKDHAAQKAGLKEGDEIISFADQEIPDVDALVAISKQKIGKEVEVIYHRDKTDYSVLVKLGTDAKTGIFGAGLGQRQTMRSTWSAPIVGVATTAQLSWVSLQGVGDLIGNFFGGLILQLSPDDSVRKQASKDIAAAGDSVAGPIGILGTIFPSAQKAGIGQLTLLTAIISLSLAVMNALPIPALDGGRWFTMMIFRLTKKKLTKKREEKIQMVGFSILIGLIILVTIADVAKLF